MVLRKIVFIKDWRDVKEGTIRNYNESACELFIMEGVAKYYDEIKSFNHQPQVLDDNIDNSLSQSLKPLSNVLKIISTDTLQPDFPSNPSNEPVGVENFEGTASKTQLDGVGRALDGKKSVQPITPVTPVTTVSIGRIGRLLGLLDGKKKPSNSEIDRVTPEFMSMESWLDGLDGNSHFSTFFFEELDNRLKVLIALYTSEFTVDELAKITEIPRHSIYKVLNGRKDTKEEGLLREGLVKETNTAKRKLTCTEKGREEGDIIVSQYMEYLMRSEERADGSPDSSQLKMIEDDVKDFLYQCEDVCIESNRKKGTIIFDFMDFVKNLHSPTVFSEMLLEEPEKTLLLLRMWYKDIHQYVPPLRIKNLPNSCFIPIGDIRMEHTQRFIKIKGTPIGCSKIFSRVITSTFECSRCQYTRQITQSDYEYIVPKSCSLCKSQTKQKEISTEQKDVQIVKLEECSEEMGKRTQPQHINVILEYDLTNTNLQHHLEESKKLIINGIIKSIKLNDKKNANSNYFVLYANSVELEVPEQSDLSQEDVKTIEKMAKQPDIIPKIVASFCPEIIDRDKEKEMLLLSAVSGGGKNFGIRDDSHVLLVGDPSLGKSFLLRGLKELFPIARWVSGNSTSGVGLIGTVKKDEQLGETMLVKGAITMANGGLVLVDELDKMRPEDRLALHEPLENQFVVLNKWDKHAEFKADCTMIAACNPKYSRFTDGEIITQINLPPTLISRFDIVIIMKDRINRSNDERIAKAVFQRISRKKDAASETIPLPLLQKYLEYARKQEPVLSPETYKIIESYYVEIREKVGINLGMTARQMEGLVRIAHARAKLRLSPTITREDADHAIQIMTFFLKQIATDHLTGNVDVDLIYEGVAGSERTMLQILRENKKMRYEDFYSKFTLPQDTMDKIIEKWRKEGTILLNRDWLMYNG